jgi:hypothetical protein
VRGAGRVQQEFEGWGTSLAWFANIIGRFADPLRSHLADLLFDVQARAVSLRRRARCRSNLRMPRAHPVRRASCANCALVPRHPAAPRVHPVHYDDCMLVTLCHLRQWVHQLERTQVPG